MQINAEQERFSLEQLNDEQVMTLYRDLQKWKTEYSAQVMPPIEQADERMALIVEIMEKRLKDRGSKALIAGGFKLSLSTDRQYNVSNENWKLYWNFILTTAAQYQRQGRDPLEAFSYLDKKPSKSAIKAYIEANTPAPPLGSDPNVKVPEALPPGVVGVDVEKKLSITKA